MRLVVLVGFSLPFIVGVVLFLLRGPICGYEIRLP